MLTAWIATHVQLASVLVIVLTVIVAFDHALASTNLFPANSTGQVVLTWLANLISWVLGLLTPAPSSTVAPQASTIAPQASASPSASAPATSATPQASSGS
jgi:hypothetical protein